MKPKIELVHGTCERHLPQIQDHTIDFVFADLPYGVTRCKWDTPLHLPFIWKHLNRICKPQAAMAFTATQPFASTLIKSNIRNFKYEYIWGKKTRPPTPLMLNTLP